MYTLNTTEVHAVAYRVKGIIADQTTPKIGCGDKCFTMSATDSHRQGGMVVIYEDSSNRESSGELKSDDKP